MWSMIETIVEGESNKTVKTYGIRVNDTTIADLSPDKEEVMRFVEQLNRCGASEIHAAELIEDFLGR